MLDHLPVRCLQVYTTTILTTTYQTWTYPTQSLIHSLQFLHHPAQYRLLTVTMRRTRTARVQCTRTARVRVRVNRILRPASLLVTVGDHRPPWTSHSSCAWPVVSGLLLRFQVWIISRIPLVLRTGRFPVSGRVAKADEWETSARLQQSADLLPKTLHCSHAELRPSTMPPISYPPLEMWFTSSKLS